MKDQEISSRVQQKLDEFERMDKIYPSADWNSSLMGKISSANQYSPVKFSTIRMNVLLLILILINVGFLLTTLAADSLKDRNRATDLRVISHELLINPVSINK